MFRYIAGRLGLALLVALSVALLSFALLRLTGDPATALAGEGARAEDIEQLRRSLGLDKPLPVQFGGWLWRVAQGDLGQSRVATSRCRCSTCWPASCR